MNDDRSHRAMRDLLSEVGFGFDTLWTRSCFIPEICGDTEAYPDLAFLRCMTIQVGSGAWLNGFKWMKLLEDPENWPKFEALLRTLENYDYYIWGAIQESHHVEFQGDVQELYLELQKPKYTNGGIDDLISASQKLD
jgi:hypothetical protein